MTIAMCSYEDQVKLWPESGRHIMAQYDDESIVVYQAYNKNIGIFAAENGYFGGEFSYTRMSWIKTGFLWMMYRSGWGTKPGQEIILAVKIARDLFDGILAIAVPAKFNGKMFQSRKQWQQAVSNSLARLQWDPDRTPALARRGRRALQLGIRGTLLEKYGKDPIEIIDLTGFVAEQRVYAAEGCHHELQTPCERVYTPKQVG